MLIWGDYFGSTLGSILLPFGDRFGVISGSRWGHLGINLGHFGRALWCQFGKTYGAVHVSGFPFLPSDPAVESALVSAAA